MRFDRVPAYANSVVMCSRRYITEGKEVNGTISRPRATTKLAQISAKHSFPIMYNAGITIFVGNVRVCKQEF